MEEVEDTAVIYTCVGRATLIPDCVLINNGNGSPRFPRLQNSTLIKTLVEDISQFLLSPFVQ